MHAMKLQVEVEVWLYILLTSVLDGDEWLAPRSCPFNLPPHPSHTHTPESIQ